ncbi:response regulator transcription factor [Cohnella silvisoli]|uniref:Response regulator n=1 Tax=Cohnella silvisoli TaxID=2873699 RepID=A0ABV1KVI8_9BACL|nr:response regulator [Cohnella silvisoli]MCD9023162.1 response regulator [Cohnella silvisoli]
MRKVMIVDDESLVRIGLQSIIDWENRGYEITGVYKNGEEALEAAKQQSFDIVLTDIRMPGMDGFELIRNLKLMDTGLKFIILSSYSDFEYTRQAIQLGVTDYISKYEMEPVELLRVLDSLQFGDASTSGSRQQGQKLQPQQAMNALADEKQRMLLRTAEGNNIRVEAEFPEIFERFEGWGQTMRWICLKPIPRETGYSPTERKAMALQAEEIFSRLKHLEFFGEDSGLLHGACIFTEEETEAEGLSGLLLKAEELKATWAKNLNIGLIAGISSNSALAKMGQSREEAEEAVQLSYYEGAGIYVREQWEIGRFTEQQWLDWYRLVKNRIQYLHFAELIEEISVRLEDSHNRLLPSEWLRLGEMISTHLMDLLIERYNLDVEGIRTRFGLLWPMTDALKKVFSRTEFMRVVRQWLSQTQEVISSMQPSRGWVVKVKQYVESGYGNPIRLEEVADLVNFSPNHFSQRFRQETGEAFSDYLTRIRIREAIRLYKETDYSTEEISARVGYLNPNYFIKVFKKTTGQTVKQFKQRF